MENEMVGEPRCSVPKENDIFVLGDLIGKGSFSSVYKAKEKITDLQIALKAFLMRRSDPNLVQRAATEMAYMKFLVHPNIIRFVFCDIQKDYMFLGMEYALYGSLRIFLRHREVHVEAAVQMIMRQLLSALCYLHSMNIVHGDIKPDNILVMGIEPKYTIKLADFGLSKIMDQAISPEQAGGSFFYMAPELLLKFPSDTRADLFSAGIVMYQLMYGKLPFPINLTRQEYILHMRKRVPPKYDRHITRNISDECFNLLRGLLNFDKQKRPVGLELREHIFLNIGNSQVVGQNHHYLEGCNCLIKIADLVHKDQDGLAYVEAVQAILQLKIHLKTIENDPVFHRYVVEKIEKYTKFAEQIQARMRACPGRKRQMLELPLEEDRLRVMLSATPMLVAAYDMCLLGQMYMYQGTVTEGSNKLQNGLSIILKMMAEEPISDRRTLLKKKADQWMKLLEDVENTNGNTLERPPQ
ncbi:hypothetical protein JTB14_033700 [Gonioctena quinquepunctata]|nr:hypothetical protein JTB14_033700 [Gonioctena quinquepunctata]